MAHKELPDAGSAQRTAPVRAEIQRFKDSVVGRLRCYHLCRWREEPPGGLGKWLDLWTPPGTVQHRQLWQRQRRPRMLNHPDSRTDLSSTTLQPLLRECEQGWPRAPYHDMPLAELLTRRPPIALINPESTSMSQEQYTWRTA